MVKTDVLEKKYKEYLREAERKGWWLACLYWSNKLDKLSKGGKI